jgi:hypothetical protein
MFWELPGSNVAFDLQGPLVSSGDWRDFDSEWSDLWSWWLEHGSPGS